MSSARPKAFVAALVLDQSPAGGADTEKLTELVRAFAEFGASHVTIVGTEADPALLNTVPSTIGLTTLPSGSGRSLVVTAVQELARAGASETGLGATLERLGGPMPDLVLVSGGRTRLDAAFTWHGAYAEFVFVEASWRNVTREDIARAIEEFAKRDRRYGAITPGTT